MRHRRIKPVEGESGFMHVYNRAAGSTGEYPFKAVEKSELHRRFRELNGYYAVEVLAVQVMGNHFHALLYVPAEPPGDRETIALYRRRYPKRRPLKPGSRQCRKVARKLRDVSEFMRELQQPYSHWFNRTRKRRRRGSLWAHRFKNTVLEAGLAVWDCWKYIEMNPVRARMVSSPADYRFCSFGQWSASGSHPYEEAINRHVLPFLKGLLHVDSLGEVDVELRKEFARMKAADENQGEEETCTAIAVAAEKEPFTTRLDRRVRYWVDGLVIGTEQFVRETMLKARGSHALKQRRFTRAINAAGGASPLCCFKQLRVLLE